MFQLIVFIYNLIFVALNLSAHNFDGLSYSSEEFDESYEVSKKSKSTSSSKKKKPKRNRSAFIIFSSETRAKLRSQNLNSNEMMVKLAEMWKSISESEKKRYYDLADQEKNRYMIDLDNFYRQNPNEVIQNKTKKNHIKKPCSAYAIYLKETKKDIKEENPDLKMADILKVVAERWKILPEDKRVEFQRKAQLEKEETQAKLNQQNGYEEYPAKKESPKKAATSGKRGQKSFDVKLEADYSLENRTDSYESYEEPTIQKHQINVGFNFYGQGNQDLTYRPVYPDNATFDMSSYNQGFYNIQSRINYEYNPNNISNLLSYLPQNLLAKQASADSVAFTQQAPQPLEYVKDEYVSYSEQESEHHQPSTATNISPKSGSLVVQGRSIEDFSNDFRLDDCEWVDRSLEFDYFRVDA